MPDARSPVVAAAVVGSGPAGFYVTAALLDLPDPPVLVDMYERLPTPWGLVRGGVAPDHPKIKSISTQFARTAAHERFRFFGNVEFGLSVAREELLARYDLVVYCVGAPDDRRLGIPGEDLPGSAAASDFVGWYNGHPDFRDRVFDLSVRRAIVVGNGNVALDVARILITPPDRLATTDIADHALEVLRGSRIEEVVVLGRRGPAQATFTTPELRELAEMTGASVAVDPAQVGPMADEHALAHVPRRNLEVLREYARAGTAGARRVVTLRFLTSPVEIRGDEVVRSVLVGHNRLTAGADGTNLAVDTGEREAVAAGLVLRAVGYRGVPLPGVPFDARAGVVPNRDGRVEGGDREYVAGWIKRGPNGIIGTNKKCAGDTVRTIAADLARHPRPPRGVDPDAIEAWLRQRQPELVDLDGWSVIDAVERRAGERLGRPRVKLCTWDELLATARGVRV
ncbi:MAG TPA: NADP oxidoreductase [Nakamurella sp.]